MNELASLRERVEILEEENRQLRVEIGAVQSAPNYQKMRGIGLSVFNYKILSLLVGSNLLRKDFLMQFLWEGEEPEFAESGISVRIHRLRKYLRRFDIELETIWGVGWQLAGENREKAAALIKDISE